MQHSHVQSSRGCSNSAVVDWAVGGGASGLEISVLVDSSDFWVSSRVEAVTRRETESWRQCSTWIDEADNGGDDGNDSNARCRTMGSWGCTHMVATMISVAWWIVEATWMRLGQSLQWAAP